MLPQVSAFGTVQVLPLPATQPEDCDAVLGGLLDAYAETLQEGYRKDTDEVVALIAKARNVLKDDLAKKEAAHIEFRRNAPLLWKGKEWIGKPRPTAFDLKQADVTIELKREKSGK